MTEWGEDDAGVREAGEKGRVGPSVRSRILGPRPSAAVKGPGSESGGGEGESGSDGRGEWAREWEMPGREQRR